ncbi:unnamed protein product [Ceratitis capitata]|uniref:(Mediterranean fruit fly) hypothetical protein n=1 Tax=Ceratitis capitata TaxID=7213 RepID=A0A811VI18_CERCA|nr:unnamed protein product [Ceratitis capitata]
MSATSHKWDKLSPREFQQLQELASYSTRKLQDVLQEFCSTSPSPKFNPDGVKQDSKVLIECDDLMNHFFQVEQKELTNDSKSCQNPGLRKM